MERQNVLLQQATASWFQFSVIVLSSHSKLMVCEIYAVYPQIIQTNIRKMSSGRWLPIQAVKRDVTQHTKRKCLNTNLSGRKLECPR